MFFAVLLAANTALRPGSPQIPPDPVGEYEFPDPAAAFFDGTYYAFGGQHMMESADLKVWSARRYYLHEPARWSTGGQGGAPGAPVKLASGGYLMTFQAEEANCSRPVCSCIGAAVAKHPSGPYHPMHHPITCMAKEDSAIDSSPRQIPSAGGLHIYFKSTGWNTLQRPSQLWGAQMHDNGTLASEPVNLLNQTAEWEAKDHIGCIEAPAMLEIDRKFFLFYSGGDWTAGVNNTPYSIGYGECKTPLGPCVKMTTTSPWFGPTYNGSVGTGGQEFFHDADGVPWIVFHAWAEGHAGYENNGTRTVRFKPLSIMPRLGTVQATGASAGGASRRALLTLAQRVEIAVKEKERMLGRALDAGEKVAVAAKVKLAAPAA